MSRNWADKIVQRLLGQGLIQTPLEVRTGGPPVPRGDLLLTGQTGICLILGAADTGKTTLAAALASAVLLRKSEAAGHAASSWPVGIIDADIGQSHIGPPATVGWAIVEGPQTQKRAFGDPDNPQVDFSQLTVGGMSFVGDVTPVGHLLQLTAAIVRCVQQVSKVAELTIIDTPGFIRGPAATALWWTVQRILQPKSILAVQRSDELRDILAGLQSLEMQIELISSPSQIPLKSPQDRRRYRQSQFRKYFRDSCLYNIRLSDIAIQTRPVRNSISEERPTRGKISNGASRNLRRETLTHRLVGLRDKKGADIAMGVITDWQNEGDIVIVRAPQLDIQQIRCLVIGDVSIEIAGVLR